MPRETSSNIAGLCKQFDLTHFEAAKIFGVDFDAFQAYDAGKMPVPRELYLLMKLVKAHPELLLELREMDSPSS